MPATAAAAGRMRYRPRIAFLNRAECCCLPPPPPRPRPPRPPVLYSMYTCRRTQELEPQARHRDFFASIFSKYTYTALGMLQGPMLTVYLMHRAFSKSHIKSSACSSTGAERSHQAAGAGHGGEGALGAADGPLGGAHVVHLPLVLLRHLPLAGHQHLQQPPRTSLVRAAVNVPCLWANACSLDVWMTSHKFSRTWRAGEVVHLCQEVDLLLPSGVQQLRPACSAAARITEHHGVVHAA